MYTVFAAGLLYMLLHIFFLRQVRRPQPSHIASRNAQLVLTGYPAALLLGAIVATVCISQYVPLLSVKRTFSLLTLGGNASGSPVFVQARGIALYPTNYLVSYLDDRGNTAFETIAMSGDIKVFEDLAPDAAAFMVKSHQERDGTSKAYNWAIFDDGDVRYKYELHVPKGSVELRIDNG